MAKPVRPSEDMYGELLRIAVSELAAKIAQRDRLNAEIQEMEHRVHILRSWISGEGGVAMTDPAAPMQARSVESLSAPDRLSADFKGFKIPEAVLWMALNWRNAGVTDGGVAPRGYATAVKSLAYAAIQYADRPLNRNVIAELARIAGLPMPGRHPEHKISKILSSDRSFLNIRGEGYIVR